MVVTTAEELGWKAGTVGELDHRLLKAPTVKLRSAKRGSGGDTVYCVDFRIRRPNCAEELTSTELHSVEHFLLEGFQRHLPAHFLSVGVMGCQTGFYLAFLNEGRTEVICNVLESILTGMRGATAVPYARIDQCGNWRNHDVASAKKVAETVLQHRATWLEVI